MSGPDRCDRPGLEGTQNWVDGPFELLLGQRELEDGRVCFEMVVVRPRGEVMPSRQVLPFTKAWAAALDVELPAGASEGLVEFVKRVKRVEDLRARLQEDGKDGSDGP